MKCHQGKLQSRNMQINNTVSKEDVDNINKVKGIVCVFNEMT